jgi:predicted RNase H-like HicB family nuclease
MATLDLTAVYETVDDGWVQARIEELPEVITAGRTRKDAEQLLLDALSEYLASLLGSSNSADSPGERQQVRLTISA